MTLLLEFLERRALVHGQMVGSVAFDQILRLFLRGMDRVPLERNDRGDLFLNSSPDVAGFGVPSHMISKLKIVRHRMEGKQFRNQEAEAAVRPACGVRQLSVLKHRQ